MNNARDISFYKLVEDLNRKLASQLEADALISASNIDFRKKQMCLYRLIIAIQKSIKDQ